MAKIELRNKLLFLNGIRGLSALWVFAAHCAHRISFHLYYLDSPSMAVDIFMIMSGFLMCYHYPMEDLGSLKLSKALRGISTLSFYIRRFFRIAPLYYLLLIPALCLQENYRHTQELIESTFPLPMSFHSNYAEPSILNILLHITFLFGLVPGFSASNLLPDWSIGLEMQFYAIFPILMIFFHRFHYFWVSISLCCISIIANEFFSNLFPLPSFVFLKIDIFLVGILLAIAKHLYDKRSSAFPYPAMLGLLILVRISLPISALYALLIALLFYDRYEDNLRISFLLNKIEWFLSNKLSCFLSDTSYSVYLIHIFFLLPVAALFSQLEPYRLLPGAIRFAALLLVSGVPTYITAWLLYRHVEIPGISFGKKILKKI